MDKLLNTMRLQGAINQNSKATVKLGTITSYDPVRYAAKVRLEPFIEEEQGQVSETNWLPIATPFVGNGWGMFCAPSIGDMIEVHFQEGSWNVGFICLRFYSLEDQPLPVPSKEFWLVHSTGSFIKLTNDGQVSIHGNAQINITSPETNISLNGSSLKKLVTDAFQTLFNTHTHGGGPAPDQQMNNSHLSATLKTD